jgi:hypothetical protein
MWAIIILAIWGVERGDLDRFPPEHVANDQVQMWHWHLEWLDQQERVAGRHWHDQFERWRLETWNIIEAWNLLWRAHFARTCSDDYWLERTLALQDHIGVAAYQAGWIQRYPDEE